MNTKNLTIEEACAHLHQLNSSLEEEIRKLDQIAGNLSDIEYHFKQEYSKIKNSIEIESIDIKKIFIKLKRLMDHQTEYSKKYRELFQSFLNRIDLIDSVYRDAYSSLKEDLFEQLLKME